MGRLELPRPRTDARARAERGTGRRRRWRRRGRRREGRGSRLRHAGPQEAGTARPERGEPSLLLAVLRAVGDYLCPRVYALDDASAVSVQCLAPPEPGRPSLDEGVRVVPLSPDPTNDAGSMGPEEVIGLYYFRNRYLDPVEGRFVNRDPIGIWGDSS